MIKESVNRPNIFLLREELPFSGGMNLSQFAARVSESYDRNSAIILSMMLDQLLVNCLNMILCSSSWRNGHSV